jgi:branched-chain amino acid transport system ATP-binding protein
MQPLLDVSGMSMNFGGLRALDNVNLTVVQDEIVALIGPNGAGKTTFFNCITGIYKPTAGDDLDLTQGGVAQAQRDSNPTMSPRSAWPGPFRTSVCFPT